MLTEIATDFGVWLQGENTVVGMMLQDSTALDLLYQLNRRFEPGDPIDEMVALQMQFKVFSPEHSLRDSYNLLNIKPADQRERKRWYRALEHLRTYDSDMAGVNGHDRLIRAYQENLESRHSRPMFTTCHSAKTDPKVVVTISRPVIFVDEDYIVLSIPTTAAPDVKAEREEAKGNRGN
jgi:hypothetical protein